jgi:cobalt/nickel transport system permease protein
MTETPAAPHPVPDAPKPRLKLAAFVGLGLAVALALAFFVSPQASSEPDGLNKVAADEGFADQETAHALDDSPVAGYEVDGVDDERLSTGLAGVVGVTVTFAVMAGLYLGLRALKRPSEESTEVTA